MPDEIAKRIANRYSALIEKVFFDRYKKGDRVVSFERSELSAAARKLNIELPKNLGDIVYSIRYRTSMPERILALQPKGMEWVIEGAGRARYAFKLQRPNRIVPNNALVAIKLPDATPEIVLKYALSDEQALLAVVRYNRLLDVFLGVATYSLQNHLRSSVQNIGQIEIDEIYVGIDRNGSHYIVPVQAKGGSDRLSAVQTKQDIAYCKRQFPALKCRPVSAQFMADDLIAMFELAIEKDDVKIVEEKHYRLVPADDIGPEDLQLYARGG